MSSDAAAAAIFTAPNRLLPPFLPDPDEDELAILVLLSAAVGSVIDLALSRFAFCRNVGSLDSPPCPCCCCWVAVGIGVDAEGGILDFEVLLLLRGDVVFV